MYKGFFRDERSGAMEPGQKIEIPLGVCLPPTISTAAAIELGKAVRQCGS